jgi:hypothetical protein
MGSVATAAVAAMVEADVAVVVVGDHRVILKKKALSAPGGSHLSGLWQCRTLGQGL